MRNLPRKIKRLRRSFNSIESFEGLLDFFSYKFLEKIAYYLVIFLCITPLLELVSRAFTVNQFDTFIIFIQSSWWIMLFQQIGLICCIVGLIYIMKNIYVSDIRTRIFIKNNVIVILLFLFLGWSFLSFLLSDNKYISFFGTAYRKDGFYTYILYFGFFVSTYSIVYLEYQKRILQTFVVTAFILSLLIVIDSTAINNFFELHKHSAVFYNINHFGYYISMAIIVALYLFLQEEQRIWQLVLSIIVFLILSSALIINTSLGPYLAVVVGMIVSSMLLRNKKVFKRFILAVALFFIMTLAFNFNNQVLISDVNRLGSDVKNIVSDSEEKIDAGSGRWPLWIEGVKAVAENPLFGYGPDNLGERFEEAKLKSDRPHNEPLQFAASLGIPAMIFYVMAISIYFVTFFKIRKRLSIMDIGIFVAVVTYFVSSQFGNTMYYTTPFYFMLLGQSIGIFKREKQVLSNNRI